MTYSPQVSWSKDYNSRNEMAYPPEYVIRIFKGAYPRLNLSTDSFEGKKIADVGCGDGRCLPFLKDLGFDVFGIEIAEDVISKVRKNLEGYRLKDSINLAIGTNNALPYQEDYFDYLLSWNACYYMGNLRLFELYVQEFARVLKKNGVLLLSIPKKSCFIYKGSIEAEPGYQVITQDPFNIRNGEVLRMFQDQEEIEKVFSPYFTDFSFASVEDDCFGYDYHWHLIVCKKK